MKLVFDFGGVLLRWRPLDFLPQWLPESCTTPEATAAMVETFFQGFKGDWAEFDRGTLAPALLAERIARRTGLSVAAARRVIDAVPHELQPVPQSVALLQRLHEAGRALHFLSNMPEPYAQHLEAVHDFLGLFRSGIFSARVQMVKPEAAIFAHAREAFAQAGEQLLFIDDALPNVHAARQAGWLAIHFRDARQCEAELSERGLL